MQNAISEKPSVLDGTVSQLFNYLNTQEDIIQSIEDRLHRILSKHKAETEAQSNAIKPQSVDFTQRVGEELYRLETNNRRLEAILSHLSEIV